ncbi:MAG: hypothetical protein OIF40_00570, partial [Mangrovicoccus sp.]|nr:hypothetical protein [Mangrovicoccus sp.]
PGQDINAFEARARLFSWLFIYTAVATVGAKWLVILRLGGMRLEMSNFGTLVLIGLLGLLIVMQRRFKMPIVLNVLLILQLVLAACFIIRGDPPTIVIMSIAATLGGYSIANATSMRDSSPVFYGAVTFFGFFVLSSFLAGVDLVGGFLEYLTSGNRDRFNYWIMRPIYNAFTSSSGGADAEFRTQLNNSVAGTCSLIYMLACAYALHGERRMIPVALFALLLVFALFSSSAVLTCLLSTFVFALYYLRHSKSVFGLYLFFVVGILGVLVAGPIAAEYMSSNVDGDSYTRATRLRQYAGAFDYIDGNMLFGVGLIKVDGHVPHNFFLFAFSAVGLFGAFASGFILLYAICMSVIGAYGGLVKGIRQPEILIATCLPILFVIRCSVGGAGGLPAGGGMVSFALALVAWRGIDWSPVTEEDPEPLQKQSLPEGGKAAAAGLA